tara:strand:+ start:1934 stop:2473 length:540 start_codon:yes stop_codon:yes gene_type:complete
MILTNKHTNTTNQRKNNLKEYKMRNNKGFTLIELIMVTIILGILAAVAIPRYMTSVQKAEMAAEDAVINAIKAGLEQYATEKLMENGRRSWPNNPWDALETKPAGYATTDEVPDGDGEWRWKTSTANIIHMRGNGDLVHWDYDALINNGNAVTNNGSNTDNVGTISTRGEGEDGNTHES